MNETKTETKFFDFETDCNKFNELQRSIKRVWIMDKMKRMFIWILAEEVE
jgi:hypothetical protein